MTKSRIFKGIESVIHGLLRLSINFAVLFMAPFAYDGLTKMFADEHVNFVHGISTLFLPVLTLDIIAVILCWLLFAYESDMTWSFRNILKSLWYTLYHRGIGESAILCIPVLYVVIGYCYAAQQSSGLQDAGMVVLNFILILMLLKIAVHIVKPFLFRVQIDSKVKE